MRIMGVDTSTKTGYVILDTEGGVVKAGVLHFKPNDNRFMRFDHYATGITKLVSDYDVDLVIIEGYSFAGKFNNSLQYELGAVTAVAVVVLLSKATDSDETLNAFVVSEDGDDDCSSNDPTASNALTLAERRC